MATVGPRGWVVTTFIESLASPTVAGIFASARPGDPWIRQAVGPHVFAEVEAIDVRDPAHAIAGGRGIESSPARAAPMLFVIGADGLTWDVAATTSRPGGSLNERVVDVARLRG
jgi:hypothetical protein